MGQPFLPARTRAGGPEEGFLILYLERSNRNSRLHNLPVAEKHGGCPRFGVGTWVLGLPSRLLLDIHRKQRLLPAKVIRPATPPPIPRMIHTEPGAPSSLYTSPRRVAVSCEGTPAGKILGLSVTYKEETSQITGNEQGDATALVKTWVVPELGCFVLQKQTIWTRNTDGVLLVDTKITPISISFQPVDEFFDIPTSYTERTKEEAWNMLQQLAATAAPLRGANDSRSTEK